MLSFGVCIHAFLRSLDSNLTVKVLGDRPVNSSIFSLSQSKKVSLQSSPDEEVPINARFAARLKDIDSEIRHTAEHGIHAIDTVSIRNRKL